MTTGTELQDVAIACRCGEVGGWLRGVSARTTNRVVCYCDDCQAFLHHLGRADLMDAQGGTDIVQVAPSTLSYERGTERIAALRLTPKGTYRWHATCCKTPLGNTGKPSLPFVGLPPGVFGDRPRDPLFGPVRGAIFGKYAVGRPPPGSTGLSLGPLVQALRLVSGWKLRGKGWPHPFFERETGAPRYPRITLTAAERAALRRLCGPTPG